MAILQDSIPHGFWAVADQDPDRTALVLDDGSVVSFDDLARRVNQISHGLRDIGLGAGSVVGAIIRNRREYFELSLATGQIGMFVVPVNWHLTGPEIGHIVQDSSAAVVIADADVAERMSLENLPAIRCAVGGTPPPGWSDFADFAADESTELPGNRRNGSLLLYTSGTTGRPKGVQRTLVDESPEDGIAKVFLPQVRGYGESADVPGVYLLCAPAYHAAPGWHSLSFLHSGHTVLIHDRFDAARTLADVERYRVTSAHMVPTHFHRLLAMSQEAREAADISSLRVLITAGAPCPPWLKEKMIDWVGPIVVEYLGSTEGGVTRVSSVEALERPGTVGKPVTGTVVEILDENGVGVPTGEPGTIWFGTADGSPPAFVYRNDPAKTASMRRGSMATVGDLGYVDEEGYLFLLDRRDDLIISGGVNIYPAEVEACLIADSAVNDVAVVGVADPEWGQRVVAVVEVAVPDFSVDELTAQLRLRCQCELAAFKHPREYLFLDVLPRSETGKLQRVKIRQDLDSRSRPTTP